MHITGNFCLVCAGVCGRPTKDGHRATLFACGTRSMACSKATCFNTAAVGLYVGPWKFVCAFLETYFIGSFYTTLSRRTCWLVYYKKTAWMLLLQLTCISSIWVTVWKTRSMRKMCIISCVYSSSIFFLFLRRSSSSKIQQTACVFVSMRLSTTCSSERFGYYYYYYYYSYYVRFLLRVLYFCLSDHFCWSFSTLSLVPKVNFCK